MQKVLTLFFLLILSGAVCAQDQKKGSPDIPGDLLINLGINGLDEAPRRLGLEPWQSKSIGIYYTKGFPVNRHIHFYPAIGVTLEKYDFRQSILPVRDGMNNTSFEDITVARFDKNRLAANFAEIPLEFRFFPWATDDGSGLFIAIAGIAGLRFESHTKLVYEELDINITDKYRDSFDLRNFRYGAMARIGTRSINAFYRINMSEFFRAGQAPEGTEEMTPYTFGISINAF